MTMKERLGASLPVLLPLFNKIVELGMPSYNQVEAVNWIRN
jgi:hypothetical protein